MFCRPTDRTRSHHPSDHTHDERRHHHPDLTKLRGWKAMQDEANIPGSGWAEERAWALRMGLTGADSIDDKSIPTFAMTPLFLGSRLTGGQPIVRAPGSARKACAKSAPFIRRITMKWRLICANR